jgi:hypothetical protein
MVVANTIAYYNTTAIIDVKSSLIQARTRLHSNVWLPACLQKLNQGGGGQQWHSNTLAYYNTTTIIDVKSFIVQARTRLHSNVGLPALPVKFKLGWMWAVVANTLAYYNITAIFNAKSFIVQARDFRDLTKQYCFTNVLTREPSIAISETDHFL